MGPNNIVMGWKHDGKQHRLPLAHARVQRLHRPALPGLRWTAACPSSCRCRAAASAPFRPTTRRSPTTASSANSAPGSATAAAWPTTSGSTISTAKRPRTSPTIPAGDIIPMWHGDRIYFLSDRDENKRLNLYCLRPEDRRRPASSPDFTEFDIKFPSLGDKAIVFENGGFIYRFDLASEKCEKVPVMHPRDLAAGPRRHRSVSRERHQLRDRARRQAGPVRRPRRCLHRPRQVRQHPQPDRHPRRPRAQLQVVARRQAGSPTSPTPAARTRSTSCPRTAAAPRGS